jgi:hypothetical protein
MTKDYNRNPKGKNQWEKRSNEEIQKIIDNSPRHWTRKDFIGKGKNNKKKRLTRTETERSELKFYYFGNKKNLKDVYKHSTSDSIAEFEKKSISEQTFRNRSKAKRFRDLMPLYKKRKMDKDRYKKIKKDEVRLEEKRRRDREYRKRQKKLLGK